MTLQAAVPHSETSFYDQLDELWHDYNNLKQLLEENCDDFFCDVNYENSLPKINEVKILEGYKTYRNRDYSVIEIVYNNIIVGAAIVSD